MEKITTIVQVFQVHGVNGANAVVVRAEGRDRLSVPRSAITQARVIPKRSGRQSRWAVGHYDQRYHYRRPGARHGIYPRPAPDQSVSYLDLLGTPKSLRHPASKTIPWPLTFTAYAQ